jgi:hypothetical protein
MASTYLDMAAANAGLKEYYEGQVMENMVYSDNPTWAMIKKNTEVGGKYYPVPIITGVSQGRSVTFSNAQGNQTPVQLKEFLMTLKDDYSIATISGKVMETTATDKMAFFRGAQLAIDGAIRSITLSLASSLFRSGTGSIGLIATGGITAGVITLDDPGSAVQFEENMVLQADATDGGAAPRAALGYVTAVDVDAGTVTVSNIGLGGAVGTNPTSWAAGDYLLVQGDLNGKMSGLDAWFPLTAPASGDNFYGVDRSVNPVRLAGSRGDFSTMSMEEAIVKGSMKIGLQGGRPDVAIVSYSGYGALQNALGSKVQYVDFKGPADIMFRGIKVNGHTSEIKVFPDRNCQNQRMYMLQMNTLELISTNECPHIKKYDDDMTMLRVGNADAAEVRVVAYSNVTCNAPGWNGSFKVAA